MENSLTIEEFLGKCKNRGWELYKDQSDILTLNYLGGYVLRGVVHHQVTKQFVSDRDNWPLIFSELEGKAINAH